MPDPIVTPAAAEEPIDVGALLGSVSTPAKAAAARRNGKLGGWPKGKPRKKGK
jgi:hypothetical protein